MAWKPCVWERRRALFARAAVVFCLGLAVLVSPSVLSAHVELMSEAGHFPHIEQAERVARRIAEEMK